MTDPKAKELREKMVSYRNKLHLDIKTMAKAAGTIEWIVREVEEGGVTHCAIARRIADVYKLTNEEYELLIPVNRRPNGGHYDPDAFVSRTDLANYDVYSRPAAKGKRMSE